ncbi:hypothetical protein [Glycocaulis sp.]|uniref:hypothetical protein n=1 Tax=Glycocaulis sp. TaxID=1969725 RepID=UPI003F7260D2
MTDPLTLSLIRTEAKKVSAMHVLADWTDQTRSDFRERITRTTHNLHTSPLFSEAAIERLIEIHPREYADFATMDETGSRSSWKTGDPGQLSGKELIRAVKSGRLWINLRNLFGIHDEYRALLDQMFAELQDENPGFHPVRILGGLLVSSPQAKVPFHMDRTDTMLWHISGKKRVFVYPHHDEVATDEEREEVLLHAFNDELNYRPEAEKHAKYFDLEPGEMICWPLHTPHRVENMGTLNISLATEYTTPEARRQNNAMYFNGVMRRRFGWQPPRIAETHGLNRTARFVAGALMRKAGISVPVETPHEGGYRFEIDPDAPLGVRA